MAKKTKFPSEAELNEIRGLLEKGPATKVLSKKASPLEKMKYLICQKIVAYKNDRKITQRQLAEKLGENESLVSKVVHYNIEEFTVDRLIKFLNVLYARVEIDLSVA